MLISSIISTISYVVTAVKQYTGLFHVVEGQSNSNGANHFSLMLKYALNISANKIWSARNNAYEAPAIGRNVTAVYGADSHGTEVGFLHHFKRLFVRTKKTAQNGTALVYDWYPYSPLDNQAMSELQAAWDARPEGEYVKLFEWNQYESSASRGESSLYKAALKALIARRESVIGRFDIIILHEVNLTGWMGSSFPDECAAIKAIQHELVAEDDRYILQNNDGKQWEVDGIHYSSNAMLQISLEVKIKVENKIKQLMAA